jgi:enoyl-CoA hydratase
MADVELAVRDRVATITLNRPDILNALSVGLLRELDTAVAQVESDADVRGVVLTGAGRAFAAGANIAEIAELDEKSGLPFAQTGQTVFSRIESLRVPVVAAVDGFALGGGCELAMACHMRVASTRARFGQPEVKLGILPGFGGTQRLPRLVGRGRATEIILTGRQVRAEEALRIGLVNDVVEPDELLPRAEALVRATLEHGPRAISASLAAIDRGLSGSLADGLAIEAELFAEVCGSNEMREGTRAFLEKRPPKF